MKLSVSFIKRTLAPSQSARDRGKGVPSFDEMMDIALVEVDFDDPTTNGHNVAP